MCAQINTKWYTGTDTYSDGDIELEILHALETGISIEELLKDGRWPIIYHFSPYRENIVRWLTFDQPPDILEIGSGMGAITGALCALANTVVCVELSMLRSKINLLRNAKWNNLEILVANLKEIEFTRKYDVVTLIGVLEYSGRYIGGNDPYIDMLRFARDLLNPGGQLIIAIENRMGLKYFAGAREDHYGKAYVGLNCYPDDSGIQTFNRIELKNLLTQAGFTSADLYFPYPDYKFPFNIVSESSVEYYTMALQPEMNFQAYDYETFDQVIVGHDMVKLNILQEFANSFLVIASNGMR